MMRILLSLLLGAGLGLFAAWLFLSGVWSPPQLRLPPTLIVGEPPATVIYDTLYEERLKSGKEHGLFAEAWADCVEILDEPVAITRWEEGVSTWEVFFATNRKPVWGCSQSGWFFHNGIDDKAHSGRALITLPKRGRPALPLTQGRSEPQNIRIEQSWLLEKSEFTAGLADQVNRSRQKDLLLFVHGFNVDFEGAIASAANLGLHMPFNGAIVAYSWPSQGGIGNYEADETINRNSTEPFVAFLEQLLAGLPEGTRVNIVVHSMGNRLVMRALNDPRLARFGKPISKLALCAPDVGLRDYYAWAPGVVARCEHVTLYASSGDMALVASKSLHNQEQRAGDAHPPVVLPGIDTIDCSALTFDFLGHSYFSNHDDVRCDLFRLLKQRYRCDGCPHLTRQSIAGGLHYWYFSDHAPRMSVVWNFEEGVVR